MHYNQYNNIQWCWFCSCKEILKQEETFKLASQEEQTALIDSCTHCNSYEEMCDIVNSEATQNQFKTKQIP